MCGQTKFGRTVKPVSSPSLRELSIRVSWFRVRSCGAQGERAAARPCAGVVARARARRRPERACRFSKVLARPPQRGRSRAPVADSRPPRGTGTPRRGAEAEGGRASWASPTSTTEPALFGADASQALASSRGGPAKAGGVPHLSLRVGLHRIEGAPRVGRGRRGRTNLAASGRQQSLFLLEAADRPRLPWLRGELLLSDVNLRATKFTRARDAKGALPPVRSTGVVARGYVRHAGQLSTLYVSGTKRCCFLCMCGFGILGIEAESGRTPRRSADIMGSGSSLLNEVS